MITYAATDKNGAGIAEGDSHKELLDKIVGMYMLGNSSLIPKIASIQRYDGNGGVVMIAALDEKGNTIADAHSCAELGQYFLESYRKGWRDSMRDVAYVEECNEDGEPVDSRFTAKMLIKDCEAAFGYCR